MLKFLQVCFVILFPVNLFAQNAKTFSWKKPEYAVVKAYLYDCDSINYDSLLIINNGRLTAEIMPDSGKVLNATQINQVIVFINSEPEVSNPKETFCFIPHHGIVFFNADGKPIAALSICFNCDKMHIYPEANLKGKSLDILKSIILETGLPVYDNITDYNNLEVK